MRRETQFSVFVVNKPGVLAAVTSALADAQVNLIAMSLMDSGDHGVLRIVCSDPVKARASLNTIHDRWTETPVLMMELDNAPGAFAASCRRLAEQNINVSYAYCTTGPAMERAWAVFKIDDVDRAMQVLQR